MTLIAPSRYPHQLLHCICICICISLSSLLSIVAVVPSLTDHPLPLLHFPLTSSLDLCHSV